MIAESDIEALNEVALEDAEEIDMKIADLERDRLATIEIKKKSIDYEWLKYSVL